MISTGLGYFFAAILLIVGKAVFDWAFKFFKQFSISKKFKKSIECFFEINSELAKLRDIYGFNRVSLIDYHNGTENLTGIGFKNTSMRHEVVDVKTKKILPEFQNIPCSLVAEMLIKLEESKKGYVIITDEGDDETAITHRMYGVKQAYNFKLGKTLVEGVISCAYTNQKHELTSEEIIEIKAIIQRIRLLRLNK